MTTLVLSGASDDLIELDGDIKEEWSAPSDHDDNGSLIAFSDGTVLRIVYNDQGVWRITPVAVGTATVTIVHAPEDNESNYSDTATIRDAERNPITWAVLASQIAR